MSDIFISHVEEDASVALQIGEGLQSAGYSTWLYERDSLPGPAYLIQTGEAIDQSQAFVLIISPDSVASNQVTAEVVRAHENNVPFLPLLHGISHVAFQEAQPLWRQAIGAATSVSIDEDDISGLVARLAQGLAALGLEANQAAPPAAEVGEASRSGTRTQEHNLPILLTSFIGREAEIREITGLFDDARCVTLTGVGGTGKTRLALEVGRESLDTYSDGVWFVDLSPISDDSLVQKEVASVLGVEEEALNNSLREKNLLLLLDNCEHLLDTCARAVSTWLGQAPEVRILATSREALGIPGEVIRRISSLRAPDESNVSCDTVNDFEATRLFVERASDVQAAFEITDANCASVARIARRLDGIPLAIELAAAMARVLSPEQIAARLDDRFRLLTGGSRTALPRQRTLQAAIDWSYHSLSDDLARLFDKLSVFRGGFTLEAAEHVGVGDNDGDSTYVMANLFQLVDKSLVVVTDNEPGADARYGLLETLRQYAGERLAESGLADDIRRRHANYYLEMIHELQPQMWGEDSRVALEMQEANHDNLRAAVDWSLEAGETETALRLVGDLAFLWMSHRYVNEGNEKAERALAATGDAPPDARAPALIAAGLTALQLADVDRATARFDESIELYREARDAAGIARATYCRAVGPWAVGDIDRAGPLLEDAIALEGLEADPWGWGWTRGLLGSVRASLGNYEGVQASLEQVYDAFASRNDAFDAGHAKSALGTLAKDRGEYVAAISHFEVSLSLFKEAGDRSSVAAVLSGLATAAWLQDDREHALTLQHESLVEFKEVGGPASISWAVAWSRFGMRSMGDTWWVLELYAAAWDMPDDMGAKSALAESLYSLGRLAGRHGDLARASAMLNDSLTLQVEIGFKRGVELALLETAALARARDDLPRAARLLGAAESAATATAPTLTDYERLEFERVRAEINAGLDGETFDRLSSEGAAMPIADATAFALAGFP
jgi:predicted ATPase